MKNSAATAKNVQKTLRRFASKPRRDGARRFFKTALGQYGHGDIFIGVSMPDIRIVVKEYRNLPLVEVEKLIRSKIHEERMAGLLMLVAQFEAGNAATKTKLYKKYLSLTKCINNWDLVDATAPYIVGEYLLDKSRGILYKLAQSKNLWDRRIAVVATYTFIRAKEFGDTLKLAEMLRTDEEDLMHKAVGWMLREVGKRSRPTLEDFLKKQYRTLPRTTLRYALEHFSRADRRNYLVK